MTKKTMQRRGEEKKFCRMNGFQTIPASRAPWQPLFGPGGIPIYLVFYTIRKTDIVPVQK